MGELLITSEPCKEYISSRLMLCHFASALIVVLFYFVSPESTGYALRLSESKDYNIVFFGIFSSTLCIPCVAIFNYVAMFRTVVRVYENGIEGMYFERFLKLSAIKLEYHEITDIDMKGKIGLVVFASEKKYTFYIQNAVEVRDAILKQIKIHNPRLFSILNVKSSS